MRGYPCTHSGLDLAGPAGTPVYAPEDLSVHAVATGALPPWRGYRPGVLVARGKETGVYHLFGHLEYDTIPSATVAESWVDALTEPIWESDRDRRQIAEGALLGLMSSANHVHWEVRSSAQGARHNPAVWLKRFDAGVDVGAYTAAGAPGSLGGGVGLLLVGALVAKELKLW